MIFLLDASVLITANNSYYPINRVPEFWDWIQHMGTEGKLKIPAEIYDEIKEGRDDEEKDLLFGWIKQPEIKKAIILVEEPQVMLVQQVTAQGYATDLTDDEVEQIGRDPFLIAYAMASPDDRCIVTSEVSKPNKIRQNRRVPDVCKTMAVRCCDPFSMVRTLDFSTSWNKK